VSVTCDSVACAPRCDLWSKEGGGVERGGGQI